MNDGAAKRRLSVPVAIILRRFVDDKIPGLLLLKGRFLWR